MERVSVCERALISRESVTYFKYWYQVKNNQLLTMASQDTLSSYDTYGMNIKERVKPISYTSLIARCAGTTMARYWRIFSQYMFMKSLKLFAWYRRRNKLIGASIYY